MLKLSHVLMFLQERRAALRWQEDWEKKNKTKQLQKAVQYCKTIASQFYACWNVCLDSQKLNNELISVTIATAPKKFHFSRSESDASLKTFSTSRWVTGSSYVL